MEATRLPYNSPTKLKVKITQSCPTLCDPMEFSRPEYRYPFPSPGDLPSPGIEPTSPALQADSLPAEPTQPMKIVVRATAAAYLTNPTETSVYTSPLVAQIVKRLPIMRETRVQSLGREDLLEKGMATHSSMLGLPWWLRR